MIMYVSIKMMNIHKTISNIHLSVDISEQKTNRYNTQFRYVVLTIQI